MTTVTWYCSGRPRCKRQRHVLRTGRPEADLRARVFRRRKTCWRCRMPIVVAMYREVTA